MRREAALTCLKLVSVMVKQLEEGKERRKSVGGIVLGRVRDVESEKLVGEVVKRLIVCSVMDPKASNRFTILSFLEKKFDHFLVQTENVRAIALAINDESFAMREMVIKTLGRLRKKNPAATLPLLREALLKLLSQLENGIDAAGREGSAQLIGQLVRASEEELVVSYLEKIVSAFISQLKGNNSRTIVFALKSLSTLAEVVTFHLVKYCSELFPLFIECLKDQSSPSKREAALSAITNLSQFTGLQSNPLLLYPHLLPLLSSLIKSEKSVLLRIKAIKLLGCLGAVDPNLLLPLPPNPSSLPLSLPSPSLPSSSSSNSSSSPSLLPPPPPSSSKTAEDGLEDSSSFSSSLEDYFSNVTLKALIGIIDNPTLTSKHNQAVQTVMYIFKGLKLRSVKYLPAVLPPIFKLIASSEELSKEFLFQQMSLIVKIVNRNILPFLSPLLQLVLGAWETSTVKPSMLLLLEELCVGIGGDHFRNYLHLLAPKLARLMSSEGEGKELRGCHLQALSLLQVLGVHLSPYLSLFLPPLSKLISSTPLLDNSSFQLLLSLLRTVGVFSLKMDLSPHLPPLLRACTTLLQRFPPPLPSSLPHTNNNNNSSSSEKGLTSSRELTKDFKEGRDSNSKEMEAELSEETLKVVTALATQSNQFQLFIGFVDKALLKNSTFSSFSKKFLFKTHKNDHKRNNNTNNGTTQVGNETNTPSSLLQQAIKKRSKMSSSGHTKSFSFSSMESIVGVQTKKKLKKKGGKTKGSSNKSKEEEEKEERVKDCFRKWLEVRARLQGNFPIDKTLLHPFFPLLQSFHKRSNFVVVEETSSNSNSLGEIAPPSSSSSSLLFPSKSLLTACTENVNVEGGSKEEWLEWMRRFSLELVLQSPSPSLKECSGLLQVHEPLSKQLFNAAFFSVWSELDCPSQKTLLSHLERVIRSPSLPHQVLITFLNMFEFMEREGTTFLDPKLLGNLSIKCRALAKALYYKEQVYRSNPSEALEDLINVNHDLQQPLSAEGILKHSQTQHKLLLEKSWYEKLGKWKQAYSAYSKKSNSMALENFVSKGKEPLKPQIGMLRCLLALGEWDAFLKYGEELWWRTSSLPVARKAVAKQVVLGKYCMGRWSELQKYLLVLEEDNYDNNFFKAVNSVHQQNYQQALQHISKCRIHLYGSLSALLGESYERAYKSVVKAQVLRELEEVMEYNCFPSRRLSILSSWQTRLYSNQKDVDVWQKVLTVRLLAVNASKEYLPPWLNFSNLCRKRGRLGLARQSLSIALGGADPSLLLSPSSPTASNTLSSPFHPSLHFTYLKQLWDLSQHHSELFSWRVYNSPSFPQYKQTEDPLLLRQNIRLDAFQRLRVFLSSLECNPIFKSSLSASGEQAAEMKRLKAKCLRLLALWKLELEKRVEEGNMLEALHFSESASKVDPNWHKAWQTFSFLSCQLVSLYSSFTKFVQSHPPSLLFSSPSLSPLQPKKPSSLSFSPLLSNDLLKDQQNFHSLLLNHFKLQHLQLKKSSPIISSPITSSPLSSPSPISSRLVSSPSPISSPSKKRVEGREEEGEEERGEWGEREKGELIEWTRKRMMKQLLGGVRALFKSISLSPHTLQDTLRLLGLWFENGGEKRVEEEVRRGFGMVSIENWLQVIPQLIARIHSPSKSTRSLLKQLLVRVGQVHPQALLYPLTVASKSPSPIRANEANELLDEIRSHSPLLVEQVELVSTELVRVAILSEEMWHEGLEEASRLYFGENNVKGMLSLLVPLHLLLKKGASTKREASFIETFGDQLNEAYEWLHCFQNSNDSNDLGQAWEIYYNVFKKINKLLPLIKSLDLLSVSPLLSQASNLQLAVPGTYLPSSSSPFSSSSSSSQVEVKRILHFEKTLEVFSTKQRPRKLGVKSVDGESFTFLLKGHEDLRQDERVMQLFGLVNTLLLNHNDTCRDHLSIVRYSVVPLSPNSGLIGWVPNCDTLHRIIKEYRDSNNIPLDLEHKLMTSQTEKYDLLSTIQKVEIFEHALKNSKGDDLQKMMWKSSRNAEVWLTRRTNFTRSLGVMSMVGHVLGLGDRHPSNLMLERHSSTVVHIDFGDCFEVAMKREKYPENVPFRLTRALSNAMEVSGIEGNFRGTCEKVMRVLRHNKDSLMAVLEAFVHDPLLNWRLLTDEDISPSHSSSSHSSSPSSLLSPHLSSSHPSSMAKYKKKSGVEEKRREEEGEEEEEEEEEGEGEEQVVSLSSLPRGEGENLEVGRKKRRKRSATIGDTPLESQVTDVINQKAVQVLNRIKEKLTGTEFSEEASSSSLSSSSSPTPLSVPHQVQLLIQQATSHENLATLYVGWCAWW